jgi:glyoxylate utilization-related uncharacterized protein
MMAKKENNWIPWVIIAGLVLYAMAQQPKGGGDPSNPAAVTAVVRSAIPSIRAAYKQAFLDAAAKIESGEIANQEQWTKFIEENAGAKRIEAMDKVYSAIDQLDLPVTFAGREAEIARINKEIASAW